MPKRYSNKRLLGFYLTELPVDINGVKAGPDFDPFLTVRDIRTVGSLRAVDPGVWSGRRHQLAGDEEFRGFKSLEGNRRVVDIREGYPLAPPEVLQNALEGKKNYLNQILTLDFVVTLPPIQRFEPLRYCGVSIKPTNIRIKPSEMRRHAKVMQRLRDIGWSWTYLNRPSDVEHFNHEKLAGWCYLRCIDEVYESSIELAAAFHRTTSKKTLRRQLTIFARRLGIPEREQWLTFAAAYYFGFLQVDHRFQLLEDGPLHLKRSRNE